MNDLKKSKSQLIQELQDLRAQLESLPNTKQLSKLHSLSPNKLQTIIDVLPGRAVVLDKHGYYVDVLKHNHHDGTYQPEDVIGKSLYEVQSKSFADFCMAKIQEVLEIGHMEVLEYNFINGIGNRVYHEGHIAPYHDDAEHETYIIWVSRDITKRKHAEEDLRQSESLLRTYIDILPDRSVILNRDGHYLNVIKRRQDQVSFQTSDVIGKTLYDVQTKEFADFCVEMIRKTIDTQETQFVEYDFINQIGNHVYYEARIAPIEPDEQGESRVMWISRDMTLQKEAEQALRESEARFRLISSVTSDYAFSSRFNNNGELENTFLSGAFETITGYSAEDFLSDGSLRARLIHPEDREQDNADMRRLQQNEQVVSELQIITRDQQVRWVRIYYHPVFDGKNHNFLGFDGGVQDITARKQAQIELDRHQHQLESLVAERTAELQHEIEERQHLEALKVRQERLAAVGQLAAGIAHDFNNVMGIITFDSSMVLRSENLTDRERQKLERIQSQARHAANLIEQILDFSRRSVREAHILDLRVLLAEIVKFLTRTIPERIQVEFGYGDGTFYASIDPTQFQQVITNFALNARDAIDGNGKIKFLLSRETTQTPTIMHTQKLPAGDWVKLIVADTGSGITQENLSKVFEPFFTTKEVGKGTGLGLAQVYGIVQQHNGYITVDSELEQGTTFTLYFPFQDGQINTIPEISHTIPDEGTGETILLVEDNEDLLDSLADVLSELNYHVLRAHDGIEALEIYDGHSKDIGLVLSDVVMPRMDGIELVRQLRERSHSLSIVMMSGFRSNTIITPDIEDTVNDWLQKPVDISVLAETIQKAFDYIH